MTDVADRVRARDAATWPLIGRVAVRWPGHWNKGMRFLRFGLVGITGVVINEGALAFCTEVLKMHYLIGVVIGTQLSSVWNFVLIEWWAFRETEAHHAMGHRIWMFFLLNNVALVLRAPIIVGMTDGLGINYLISNLISLVFLIIARFGLSDTLIWKPAEVADPSDV